MQPLEGLTVVTLEHAVERLVRGRALAPGAASRLGLGYDKLAAKKPGIVVCDISGDGADGPCRDKKACDLLIQSEAGSGSVTGTGAKPCKAGPPIADIAAGMYACIHILAAPLQRSQTGKGQHIGISMHQPPAEGTRHPRYYVFEGDPVPALGEHTDALLAEVGIDADGMRALHAAEAI